jgi:acetolactate synthase-1/2/3 large subunit
MAEAWGKATGEVGVCFVTRGPGVANAMAGLHVADQDSTPMVLLLGMPDSSMEEREAFQEVEVKQLFSSFVKWAAVIRDRKRIPEYVSRAFHVAKSGRPGPVVLGLPEDMLFGEDEVVDAKPARIPRPSPGKAELDELEAKLKGAKRPLVIVGGPGWSKAAQTGIEAFGKAWDLPISTAFRFQDYMDNRHPNYVGCVGIGIEPALADAVRNADVLVAIGARMGEATSSGYTLLDIPNPKQFFVHVHPSPDELQSVYRADLPIVADGTTMVEVLGTLSPPASKPWSGQRAELRKVYEESLKPITLPGEVKFAEIVRTISKMLPETGLLANGAGNFAAFVHRYFEYKGFRDGLSPTSGSMGYGLPAAIAAQLAFPTRTIVNVQGDGDFMMTSQELATVVQYGLPIITIIANNGTFGTIRMHQEREYPGRVVGTTLMNPDFAAMARSFGMDGVTIERTADFAPAFEKALAARKPILFDVKLDPEALAVKKTLTQIREKR